MTGLQLTALGCAAACGLGWIKLFMITLGEQYDPEFWPATQNIRTFGRIIAICSGLAGAMCIKAFAG